MAKVVIVPIGKKLNKFTGRNEDIRAIRNQSDSTGEVESFEDMNYKHFINTYNKLNCRNGRGGEYDLHLLSEYPEMPIETLIEIVLEGEAAKRELLSRDWVVNNELYKLEAEIKAKQAEIKQLKSDINSLKAK